MSPEDVLREMKDSGLRGRGGAGFLTGLKWEFARRSQNFPKYVICNADEGDPGAFMDRSILEGDPHSVMEGMTIAGYAIGAAEGYIYCRAEYPLAIARLKTAIAQAHEYGLLGENILGSGFSFDLKVKEGAGAFVCGEETALMASIEGKRGEPRPRPPFPAVVGPLGEALQRQQRQELRHVAPDHPEGRAVVQGHRPGEIARHGHLRPDRQDQQHRPDRSAHGHPAGRDHLRRGRRHPEGQAVQGGADRRAAGRLSAGVGAEHPGRLRRRSTAAGATMGSGGMIVVDDDTCMVEFAKYFLQFATAESCGKCVPCRVGGMRLLETLTRITEGKGAKADIETIKYISQNMREASLCSLGQLTPGPVMSGIRFFEQEFIQHIEDKMCEAGQCKALVRAKCINACPAGVESPAYLALVAQGRYAEGLEIHRQRNPFALVCGRVCPAFCEQKCRRGEIDEPISIRLVKRFMADQEIERPWTPERIEAAQAARRSRWSAPARRA